MTAKKAIGGQSSTINIGEDASYAVFKPILRYLEKGDIESLAVWFDSRLELGVDKPAGDVSASQAKKILEWFFGQHSCTELKVLHRASRANLKSIVLQMKSTAESYQIRIFMVRQPDEGFLIHQFKITKL